MGGIGNPVHLIFIAVVALIVLGPKRLPDLARSLGTGMREFRESISGAGTHAPEVHDPLIAEPPPATEPLAAPSAPPPPVAVVPDASFGGAVPAPAPAVPPPPVPVDPGGSRDAA